MNYNIVPTESYLAEESGGKSWGRKVLADYDFIQTM